MKREFKIQESGFRVQGSGLKKICGAILALARRALAVTQDPRPPTPNTDHRSLITDHRLPITSLLLPLLALALPALANGQVRDATLRFEPDNPFIGQPFKVVIEVAVTPGVELENLEISGLPDASRASLVNLVRAGRNPRRGAGEAADILRYTADGRGLTAFAGPFMCTVRGLAVERVTRSFFSHTRSAPVSFRTTTADLAVRALPRAGRPADFSGAVGRFILTGSAEPLTVAPDDLVTLSYTLTGSGWLAEATLDPPDMGPDFKCYPPRTTVRETSPPKIVLEQVVIPLSTNATEIASPRFSYFDPAAAIYRTATLDPARLIFGQAVTNAPAVRRIDATPAIRAATDTLSRPPELAITETVAKLRQLLPLAAALLFAVGVVAAGYRIRRIPALLAALLILAAGVVGSRRLNRAADARLVEIGTTVTARLAPSEKAMPLFDLNPGAGVIPLEHAPNWIRIRATGREAWIPAAALAERQVTSDQ